MDQDGGLEGAGVAAAAVPVEDGVAEDLGADVGRLADESGVKSVWYAGAIVILAVGAIVGVYMVRKRR